MQAPGCERRHHCHNKTTRSINHDGSNIGHKRRPNVRRRERRVLTGDSNIILATQVSMRTCKTDSLDKCNEPSAHLDTRHATSESVFGNLSISAIVLLPLSPSTFTTERIWHNSSIRDLHCAKAAHLMHKARETCGRQCTGITALNKH